MDSNIQLQFQNIIEKINTITYRLDTLEKSNIDWVALFIGIGSIVTAIITIVITVKWNRKNIIQADKLRKEGNLQVIKSNIDSAKMNFQTISLQMIDVKNLSEEAKNNKLEQISVAQELVLNAYEDGCDAFYKNKVDQQDFIDKYDPDIGKYIEQFPDKFSNITMYNQMLKYHKEYHKNKTAKK